MCLLNKFRISDFYYVSQGKTRIPGVNDGEEFQITDVSATCASYNLIIYFEYIIYSCVVIIMDNLRA